MRFLPPVMIVLGALALSLSFSVKHLYSNQLLYYLPYFGWRYPENFSTDYFVQHGLSHPIFGLLLIGLGRLFELSSISLLGSFTCWLLIAFGFYLFASKLYPDNPATTFAVGIIFMMGFGLPGLGGMHIGSSIFFLSVFEPFFLAAALGIAGLGLLVHERYLAAGIALAAGGLMHVHIMVFLLPVVVLFLAVRKAKPLRETWLFFVPIILVNAPYFVFLVYKAGLLQGTHEQQVPAWKIAADFRNPHHTHAWEWASWSNGEFRRYISIFLFQIGALAISRPDRRSLRVVGPLLAMIACEVLLFCATAIALTSSWIGRFEVWKLSPMLTLLGWTFAAGAMVKAMAPNRTDPRDRRLPLYCGLGVAGLIFTASDATRALGLSAWCALALAVGLVESHAVLGQAWRGRLRTALFILLAMTAGGLAQRGWANSMLSGGSRSEAEGLFAWARTTTAKSSLFLIPPGLAEFRTNALRSVVVDLKEIPMDNQGIGEWYRRIGIVSGKPNPGSMREAIQRYDTLAAPALTDIAQQFACDFIVVRADRHTGNLDGLAVAYADWRFKVLAAR